MSEHERKEFLAGVHIGVISIERAERPAAHRPDLIRRRARGARVDHHRRRIPQGKAVERRRALQALRGSRSRITGVPSELVRELLGPLCELDSSRVSACRRFEGGVRPVFPVQSRVTTRPRPPSLQGAAREDPSGDRRAQQASGWIDEAGHADERGCQIGVLSGGGVEAADVAAEQSLTRRGTSRHTGQGEVGAGDHLPRRFDDGGEFVVEPPRSESSMAAEVAAEGDGALGGEGHALAVDRVEAAEAVTEAGEAVGDVRGVVRSDVGRWRGTGTARDRRAVRRGGWLRGCPDR